MSNRAERRRLKKQGKKVERKPTYNLSLEEIAKLKMPPTVQTAVDEEIGKQLLGKDKEVTLDMDSMVIWVLRTKLGFGPKRAKQFYLDMFREHMKLREHYKMNDAYPQRALLKREGIDVEAWYNELFDEEGNYKDPDEVTL